MAGTERLSDRAVAVLRLSAGAAGLVLITVSLLADRLLMSSGTGFSRNQLMILLLGVGLVCAALLGRRFPKIYAGLALLILNLLLAAVLVDLGSLALLKLTRSPDLALRVRKVEEGGLDRTRAAAVQSQYVAWTVWRALPDQAGESTDSAGHRITPGSIRVRDGEGLRIFVLGGSTSWGLGVADSVTVCAYLVRRLAERSGEPVELTNLSQIGYVTTQELIELELQLRRGSIPDLVVCLDGFNDVFTAYQSGIAGVHQNFLQTAELLEGRAGGPSLSDQLWRLTNVSILVDLLRHEGAFGADAPTMAFDDLGIDRDSLALGVAGVATGNYDLVRRLGESYGFRCLFLLQPTIWTGHKPLTAEERQIEAGTSGYAFSQDPEMKALLRESYAIWDSLSAGSPGEHDLSDVFDSVGAQVYTDPSGVHLNSLGDSLLAEAVARLVRPGAEDE